MLDAETLQDMWSWDGQRRAREGLSPGPRFTSQGLELGAGTIIARAVTDRDGRTRLDLTKDGERAATLLAVAYDRLVGGSALRRLRAASEAWSKGDLSLAQIILVHAGLGRLHPRDRASRRLYMAEKLLDWGTSPYSLLKGLDLLPRDLPLDKASPNDPEHPGWPKDTPDSQGGRFMPKGQGGITLASASTRGMGDNKGPPLEPPPIPKAEPATRGAANAAARGAVAWMVGKGVTTLASPAGRIALGAALLGGGIWAYPYIKAYFDGPKTLEQLQQDVANPGRGYEIHHIVEQGPAKDEGFSRDQIDDPSNLVRIPTFKHWELNKWYETATDAYEGLTPRQYLRGKDWATKQKVGLDGLAKIGVLKQ